MQVYLLRLPGTKLGNMAYFIFSILAKAMPTLAFCIVTLMKAKVFLNANFSAPIQ